MYATPGCNRRPIPSACRSRPNGLFQRSFEPKTCMTVTGVISKKETSRRAPPRADVTALTSDYEVGTIAFQ